MTRIPRIHIEGALYYVTARGDHEEKIFQGAPDYEAYLELLRKYKKQYGFKLFAFCLLPTHLHLLIELKEGITISDILHDLNANYTKYFNGRYARKGHLFQERSKIVVVEKKQYLPALSSYIHSNPLELGLVKDLKDYAYSSYLYYAGIKPHDDSANITDVIARTAGEAKQDEAISGKGLSGLLGKELILGSREFKEKIEAYLTEANAPEKEVCAARPRYAYLFGGIGVFLVLILVALVLCLHARRLKCEVAAQYQQREQDISKQAQIERKKIYQGLDEKYRADRVSFEAMSKRLEMEKKKVKELESRSQ